MDGTGDTPDVKVTYTSHRYWRIIFPLFALLIIFEYIVIFFMFPASTDIGIIAENARQGFKRVANNSGRRPNNSTH